MNRWGLALLVLVSADVSCSQEKGDPSLFVGTWTYTRGAVQLNCGVPEPTLVGSSVVIRPGTASDLELEVSCHCRIKLQIQEGFTAVATGRQTCDQVVAGNAASTTLQGFSFSLGRDDDGTDLAQLQLSGASELFVALNRERLTCADVRGQGTLVRGLGSPDCGPDETAVGVLPYSPTDGLTDCPTEAGRDGVSVYLDNDNDRFSATPPPERCTHITKSLGQGAWVLPGAVKNINTCDPKRGDTFMPFCRVDGRLFRPTTADAQRREQSYALLKLGSRCPDGAIEMKKRIDTEWDPMTRSNINLGIGDLGPVNHIGLEMDSTATLAFCFFAGGAAATGTMTEFPALGFPYAVFHDFDGAQPPWVQSKMWLYSDDEDTSNGNSYDPDPHNGFDTIIEDVNEDTCFDVARVR